MEKHGQPTGQETRHTKESIPSWRIEIQEHIKKAREYERKYKKEDDYLFPGDAIKWIGAGEGYRDYLLSQVLASHGCVIRDIRINGGTAVIQIKRCEDGNCVDFFGAEIEKIPDSRDLNDDERKMAFHSRDLIVRYQVSEDESLSHPMWHTVYRHLFDDYIVRTLTVL